MHADCAFDVFIFKLIWYDMSCKICKWKQLDVKLNHTPKSKICRATPRLCNAHCFSQGVLDCQGGGQNRLNSMQTMIRKCPFPIQLKYPKVFISILFPTMLNYNPKRQKMRTQISWTIMKLHAISIRIMLPSAANWCRGTGSLPPSWRTTGCSWHRIRTMRPSSYLLSHRFFNTWDPAGGVWKNHMTAYVIIYHIYPYILNKY